MGKRKPKARSLLDDIFEVQVAFARERLREKGEVHQQLAFHGAPGADGKRQVAIMPVTTRDVPVFKLVAVAMNAEIVSHISEAWMKTEPDGRYNGVLPSQSERREEALMVVVIGRDRQHRIGMFAIERDAAGTPSADGPNMAAGVERWHARSAW